MKFSIAPILLIALLLGGCELAEKYGPAIDQAAAATTRAVDSPIVRVVAGPFPWGETVIAVAGAVAGLWIDIRRRRWKSAFQTVVRTVEPFVPSDEPSRDALRLAQGEAVTAMVKEAKR